MNILTKIFIVVLVPLILIACSVFLTLSVNTDNWRVKHDVQKQANAVLEQQNKNLKDGLSATGAQLAAAREETGGYQRQLADERNMRATMLEGVQKSQELVASSLKQVQDQNASFLDTQNAAQATVNRVLTDMTKLHGELVEALEAKIKLDRQLAEVSNRLLKIEEENKLNLEQIKLLQYEKAQIQRAKDTVVAKLIKAFQSGKMPSGRELQNILADGTSDADGGLKVVEARDVVTKIQGKVTTARDDMASVNVGANQGVQKGMRLVLIRNNTFIGYLEVAVVEPVAASGVVIEKRANPIPGDEAMYPSPAKTSPGGD